MSNTHLATYLNDHLAGSELALEMLRRLETEQAGHPIASLASEIHREIDSELAELKSLMSRLEISQSLPRKATGWLTEKATQVKLRLDDLGGGSLRPFEILEALSLGIEGKRSLWRVLEAASELNEELRGLDYTRLKTQAENQRSGVEHWRIETGRTLFGSTESAE